MNWSNLLRAGQTTVSDSAQLWVVYFKGGVDKLEVIQRRPVSTVRGLDPSSLINSHLLSA